MHNVAVLNDRGIRYFIFPVFFIFPLAALWADSHPNLFNVRDFGASGDSTQYAQRYLQQAIDSCYAAGGGTVYFPPGSYKTGTIVLKDNVALHLEAGATVWASRREQDYQNDFIIYKKYDSGKLPGEGTPVLIYAKNAKNIGITGKGRIHGQAERTYEDLRQVDGFISEETENARRSGVEMKMYYKVKPYTCMIFLEDCENITIRDISLIESIDWTLHFKWCRRIFVQGVYIFSSLEAGVNADGIDIDGCQDVVISDCIIQTGDDSIVLKSTITGEAYQPCENITVTNCSLVSTSTGLKLGTESFGDFRHIVFNNCVVRNSNRGLSIVVRDGGTVSDVLFSNITIETDRKDFFWWGDGDPIWLVVKKRNPDSKVGKIRNVTFQNIVAHGQGTSRLEGFSTAYPLENIRLQNVQLNMSAEDKPDKRATDILQAHDVHGLLLSDISLHWDTSAGIEPKWAAGALLSNIKDLEMNRVRGRPAPESTGVSAFYLRQVENAYITETLPTAPCETLFEISGAETRNLVFRMNDPLDRAVKKIQLADEVNASEVRYE